LCFEDGFYGFVIACSEGGQDVGENLYGFFVRFGSEDFFDGCEVVVFSR
jgi:hypothetical protein